MWWLKYYKKCLLGFGLAMLLCFAAGYGVGIRSTGNNTSANREAGAVTDQLGAAEANQRQLDAGIRQAAESNHQLGDSLGRSSKAVSDSKTAADGLATANSALDRLVEESARNTESSQRIISEILNGTKTDPPAR